jgi:hypothetical protein
VSHSFFDCAVHVNPTDLFSPLRPPLAMAAAAASDASARALRFASDLHNIASLSSASELLLLAQRWRESEGTTRTPFVLLQLLALTRQFVCLTPEPKQESLRKKATWHTALKKHGERKTIAANRPSSPQAHSPLTAFTALLVCFLLPLLLSSH